MADIINNQPLVTVGICCYNREEGFKHTLQCITNQTYKNLEIIISQDFNTTLDLSIVAEALNDKRITFYKQQQRLSMYNNFSFVLKKANGDYFMWASDDDWWSTEFIEEIMKLLIADPIAIGGFTNFMAVDESNTKISSYPDFLPLLQEFNVDNDIKRIKNYINQFEGFGKANLFYSIFKTSALRTSQVIEFLNEGDLPCDMLINLSVLIKGKILIVPQLLRTCTVGNIKDYDQLSHKPRLINLGIAYLNIGSLKHIHKKWSKYIFSHFKVIRRSELSFCKKTVIYPILLIKVLLFYYDLICNNATLRSYNIFSKIKRKNSLN
jgi:glycosyltransferase involved in cell wall biosynthesis